MNPAPRRRAYFQTKQLRKAAIEYSEFAVTLPDRLERIFRQLDQGELFTRTADVMTGRLVRALGVVFNRLIQGIGIAALLLGLILIFVSSRETARGDGLLRIALFVSLGVFILSGITYIVSYWRSRRL